MKRVLIALVLVVALVAPFGSTAKDAPGCDGLEQFRADLMPIGQRWADALNDAGLSSDRDVLTYSSDDWRTLAGIALTYGRELRTIDAPDWLNDWLQLQIQSAGIKEQVAIAVADGGMFAILGFTDQLESFETRQDEAAATAESRCPDFAQLAHDWSALDDEIDGTPVPTPTR